MATIPDSALTWKSVSTCVGAGENRGQSLRKIRRRPAGRDDRRARKATARKDRARRQRARGPRPRVRAKFGDAKREFGRRDDRLASAKISNRPRHCRKFSVYVFAGRERRRIARPPVKMTGPRLPVVRHRAAHFAKTGAVIRFSSQ